jgi:hypothetical protein
MCDLSNISQLPTTPKANKVRSTIGFITDVLSGSTISPIGKEPLHWIVDDAKHSEHERRKHTEHGGDESRPGARPDVRHRIRAEYPRKDKQYPC